MNSTEKMKLQRAKTALNIALKENTCSEKDKAINTALLVLNDLLAQTERMTVIEKIKKTIGKNPIPVPTDPTIKDK